jgi:PhnB protein
MATKAKRFIPEGYTTVTPFLSMKGADKAIDFYKKAFNASELYRLKMPDGSIGYCELQIGNSRVQLAEASETNEAMGGTKAALVLYVEDCDSLFKQAVTAGGKERVAVQDMFWGDRAGTFEDPYGHKWTVCTHKEDLTPEELEQRMKSLKR